MHTASEGRSSHPSAQPADDTVLHSFAFASTVSDHHCSDSITSSTTTRSLLGNMADPISLTAAAAGFIGLAGQLAQGVMEIREIYATINHAPQDVANLCSRMEGLQGVLEEVGDQIQQLSPGNINLDTRILRDVITQCEMSRYRVEAHVKDLSDGFRQKRGAAMRYVFKKKEIHEMLSDVEQCKSSLIIARQSIDGYVGMASIA